VPKVQEFWSAAAYALAAHLQQTGVYGSLTLVHIPGLSVYDEELRLPTGFPKPTSADTQVCPDGRPAYPTVITDADTSRWRTLGYSDSAVINGFKILATAFAQAFPDRVLGLSLFPLGAKGIDFPNLAGDPAGYVASQIIKEVTAIAPGRVQIQSDNLDGNYVEAEVLNLSSQYSVFVGWQSNKHGETGAGCDGGGAGSCNPDGPTSPFFQLLQNGSQNHGTYLEVWSTDVVSYPQSIFAAKLAGLYTLTDVQREEESITHLKFELQQNYPNPFNPSTRIAFTLAKDGMTILKIFDVLGREVALLVNGPLRAGVLHQVQFDASKLPSGIYFSRLESSGNNQVKKLVLLK
jgi:hypothetical protein